MSESSRAASPSLSTPPVVVGYVEAVTATAALGWVWCPGRADRITVELRLGQETISRATADGMRDDLARSGIGDGRHAFTLELPEEYRAQSGELKVFAVPDGGTAIALDAPSAANTAQESTLAPLQRGLDMLIGSQRLLHRNLQAALLQKGPSVTASLADVAATQTALGESIATLELFVVRLEQALALRENPAPVAATHRLLLVTVGVAMVALIASCLALARVVLGS